MKTKTKQSVLLVSVLPGWAALVAFQVGASFGFAATGLLGLLIAVSLAGFFAAVVVGVIRRRWRVVLYFGTGLFVVLSSSWAAGFISARQREASIAAAKPIIAAVGRFYSATGYYPQSLADLVPTYLPIEPRTRMGFRGTPFTLSVAPDRFYVSFELPGWMRCSYDSASKQWNTFD